MLVKSAQNQSISSEICPENSHEIGRFYLLFFGEVSPENFREIPAISADFSANLSKNPAKLDFFLRDRSDTSISRVYFTQSILHAEIQINDNETCV